MNERVKLVRIHSHPKKGKEGKGGEGEVRKRREGGKKKRRKRQ